MKVPELVSFLKSLTIVIPLTIGLIRFKKIDESYYPFLLYLITGFITEVITFVFFALPHKSNAPVSNLYVLAEWILILWLFYRWRFFKRTKTLFYFIAFLGVAVWITENLIYARFLKDYSPFFRFFYYFILVLISINVINYTIVNTDKNLLQNARFLICLSFIIVFTYKLIYEWAYQYTVTSGEREPRITIIAAFGYVNAFQKILCSVAVFFIPAREEF